ncbi:MAG: hypothetical protein N4A54_02755 [Peptostreptococcaceae bacterium]|nr:hypothetical protein [Peptostreptococcaceae bacterium]
MTKKTFSAKKSIDGVIIVVFWNVLNKIENFNEKKALISALVIFSILYLNNFIFKKIDNK